jgi:hypothetical protein
VPSNFKSSLATVTAWQGKKPSSLTTTALMDILIDFCLKKMQTERRDRTITAVQIDRSTLTEKLSVNMSNDLSEKVQTEKIVTPLDWSSTQTLILTPAGLDRVWRESCSECDIQIGLPVLKKWNIT